MEFIINTLFFVAIILFAFSFTKKEHNAAVEQQIEGFSISLMKELYKVKNRIKLLEEEMLIKQDKQNVTEQSPNLHER